MDRTGTAAIRSSATALQTKRVNIKLRATNKVSLLRHVAPLHHHASFPRRPAMLVSSSPYPPLGCSKFGPDMSRGVSCHATRIRYGVLRCIKVPRPTMCLENRIENGTVIPWLNLSIIFHAHFAARA